MGDIADDHQSYIFDERIEEDFIFGPPMFPFIDVAPPCHDVPTKHTNKEPTMNQLYLVTQGMVPNAHHWALVYADTPDRAGRVALGQPAFCKPDPVAAHPQGDNRFAALLLTLDPKNFIGTFRYEPPKQEVERVTVELIVKPGTDISWPCTEMSGNRGILDLGIIARQPDTIPQDYMRGDAWKEAK